MITDHDIQHTHTEITFDPTLDCERTVRNGSPHVITAHTHITPSHHHPSHHAIIMPSCHHTALLRRDNMLPAGDVGRFYKTHQRPWTAQQTRPTILPSTTYTYGRGVFVSFYYGK